MKKIIVLLCFMMVLSCKKDEKISNAVVKETSDTTAEKDSTVNETATMLSPENRSPKLQPLNEEAELGKVIFTQNDLVMLAFNNQSQSGKIVIDGKEYKLNKINFSENNYEISGDGIKITAEDGNFKEMVSDCLYGNFPSVKIQLNDKEINLQNVNVQDCPAY